MMTLKKLRLSVIRLRISKESKLTYILVMAETLSSLSLKGLKVSLFGFALNHIKG